MKDTPTIPITGFWMLNDTKGRISVLVKHRGKWITVFGPHGPGPVACDDDQIIDHMIHAGGIQNLIDYGNVHGPKRKTVRRKSTAKRTTKARR